MREVNRLERVLLATLDFDLRIEPEQYRLYEATLFSLCSSPNGLPSVAAGLPQKPGVVAVSAAPAAALAAIACTGHSNKTPPVSSNAAKEPTGGSGRGAPRAATPQRSEMPKSSPPNDWSRDKKNEPKNAKNRGGGVVLVPVLLGGTGTSCAPWSPASQLPVLDLDMSVKLATAAGEGTLRYQVLGGVEMCDAMVRSA